MKLSRTLQGLLASVAIATTFSATASAQACESTEFTSKNAEFYLKAETEILQNNNPTAALVSLNQLRAQDLNCYELGAALRLGAAIKIQAGNYLGAVEDLEETLARGYVAEPDKKDIYFNIAQIYLTQDSLEKALSYYDLWMGEGGAPDRDQKWQLAVLNQKLDKFMDSLRWAEEVLEADGRNNAPREVYDFLIYLYDETDQKAKKAELLELLLAKNPNERRLWDAIAGDYFQADEERKAFEVQKAMYLAGILDKEEEIVRIVNFYNRFDVPFQGAAILEKEINQGRIEKTYARLELLANLYQVAREFERAIPVIEEAAQMSTTGDMYERLGRSYSELQDWEKAEEALQNALNKGGLKDRGLAWVLIGQSRYERDDRAGAREAFRSANNRSGRGWIDFMGAEDATEVALARFEISSKLQDAVAEKDRCNKLAVLGDPPEACQTVDDRIEEAETELAAFDARVG
ncbi:MAG: tetratricopeptide repeat protein [Pseudomonadota bacterium]